LFLNKKVVRSTYLNLNVINWVGWIQNSTTSAFNAEGFCILGHNAIYSVENGLMFRRNTPPSSRPKNKKARNPKAVSSLQAFHTVVSIYHCPKHTIRTANHGARTYLTLILKDFTEPGEKWFHTHSLSEIYRNYQTESR
jgi:hypothetical protein